MDSLIRPGRLYKEHTFPHVYNVSISKHRKFRFWQPEQVERKRNPFSSFSSFSPFSLASIKQLEFPRKKQNVFENLRSCRAWVSIASAGASAYEPDVTYAAEAHKQQVHQNTYGEL